MREIRHTVPIPAATVAPAVTVTVAVAVAIGDAAFSQTLLAGNATATVKAPNPTYAAVALHASVAWNTAVPVVGSFFISYSVTLASMADICVSGTAAVAVAALARLLATLATAVPLART